MPQGEVLAAGAMKTLTLGSSRAVIDVQNWGDVQEVSQSSLHVSLEGGCMSNVHNHQAGTNEEVLQYLETNNIYDIPNLAVLAWRCRNKDFYDQCKALTYGWKLLCCGILSKQQSLPSLLLRCFPPSGKLLFLQCWPF